MAKSEKCFIRLAALLLSLLLPFSAFAGSLFPSADSLFGVAMPDMRFAIGREPDSVEETTEGEIHIYRDFTAAEYTLFSQYLASENVTLKTFNTEMSLFTAELELSGGTIIMKYDCVSDVVWIVYPENTRPERIASTAELPREGILPDLRQVFVNVPMPSFGEVLHRYPDEVTHMADGSQEQRWSGLTDANFEAFGAYLAAQDASLRDYAVTDGIFSAAVEKEGREFRFTYDSARGIATVTYPYGVYDERMHEAEERYSAAMALMVERRYDEALSTFRSIRDHEGYRDVAYLIENDAGLSAAAAREEKLMAFRSVGCFVTFGSYEQDNNTGNGKEPIEWVVLEYDSKRNRAMLLSRYGLDAKRYNARHVEITWEKSTLRTWLNGAFIQYAFNIDEQDAILTMYVDNSKSQGYWGMNGGNNTDDKVFLLSYAEANKYLGVTLWDNNNMKSRTSPTAYAIQAGAWASDRNKTADDSVAGWWWLRSPGFYPFLTALVRDDGSLDSCSVINVDGCVRPALWIDLGSDIF